MECENKITLDAIATTARWALDPVSASSSAPHAAAAAAVVTQLTYHTSNQYHLVKCHQPPQLYTRRRCVVAAETTASLLLQLNVRPLRAVGRVIRLRQLLLLLARKSNDQLRSPHLWHANSTAFGVVEGQMRYRYFLILECANGSRVKNWAIIKVCSSRSAEGKRLPRIIVTALSSYNRTEEKTLTRCLASLLLCDRA